jgi:nucleoid-associated protein YgaU
MVSGDLFKLEKLKIEAFSDVKRTERLGSFEAMFNPETLSQHYENNYLGQQSLGGVLKKANFRNSGSQSLTLELLLDGTNVPEMGSTALSTETVLERIDRLLGLAYRMNGEIHEPNYLIVRWGAFLAFPCRLQTLGITYTTFDRDGAPLRAKLNLTLLADDDSKRQERANAKSSPDVSHTRIVVAGDTLPLMTRRIYGTSAHYIKVARANKFDHFRAIAPGQQILFPPLAK